MCSLTDFTVEAGQRATFVLNRVQSHDDEPPRYDPEEAERLWTESIVTIR